MASAIMAGIAVYGAASGAVVAGVTISAAGAAAIGAAAALGMMAMENSMRPDSPSESSKPVSIGDKAQPIDKTRIQEEADVGKLKLGEDDAKAKRKKGKAAFKIELDKKAAESGDTGPNTGVQVAAPKDLGVQL